MICTCNGGRGGGGGVGTIWVGRHVEAVQEQDVGLKREVCVYVCDRKTKGKSLNKTERCERERKNGDKEDEDETCHYARGIQRRRSRWKRDRKRLRTRGKGDMRRGNEGYIIVKEEWRS